MPCALDLGKEQRPGPEFEVTAAGEIIPQALCSRFGLQIGAYSAWFVHILLWMVGIISFPISKVLDYLLGSEHGVSHPLGITLKEMRVLGPTCPDLCPSKHRCGADANMQVDLDASFTATGMASIFEVSIRRRLMRPAGAVQESAAEGAGGHPQHGVPERGAGGRLSVARGDQHHQRGSGHDREEGFCRNDTSGQGAAACLCPLALSVIASLNMKPVSSATMGHDVWLLVYNTTSLSRLWLLWPPKGDGLRSQCT